MTVRPLVELGDPALRTSTSPVPPEALAGSDVQTLIDDLVDTLRAANGAGIAAPQIGSALRIAVIEVRADTTHERYPYKPLVPLTVLVNPVLTPRYEGTAAINEGCLSVPGIRGELRRFRRVHVAWLDRKGRAREREVAGVTAGTFQHECDHLDGRVFVDRVSDTSTLTTWDNYERHHRVQFEARMHAYVAEMGA